MRSFRRFFDKQIEPEVIIGKYSISKSDGKVCIYIVNDGEGMTTNIEDLESVIDIFYNDNF